MTSGSVAVTRLSAAASKCRRPQICSVAAFPLGVGFGLYGVAVFTACHCENGQGGIKDRLVGGQGTLASDHPIKTVGSLLAQRHHVN
jgi:hypothetical protein